MPARSQVTRDLFISHAWRFHEDWKQLADMLDAHDPHAWRNFSLPWFDPALNPATVSGRETLLWTLEAQIIPVHAMILLAGVFAQPSSRKWIDFEVEMARKHSKPIVALPAWGETEVSPEAAGVADGIAEWDVDKLLGMLDLVVPGNWADHGSPGAVNPAP